MLSFEQAWPKLNVAASIGDEITKEEAKQGLRNGVFSFFSRKNSAAIVASYGDTLRIGIAGGDLDELQDIEEEICEYALQGGYTYIDIIGRVGWERVLPDYERVAVVLRKQVQ